MTRVAVCIPTRNGAAWIAGAIDSVLRQDVDLEVVISDDASSDATAEIAASTGDPRVRVDRSATRLGMASNWNRAIELSTSSYVKVLMQDDELLPGSLVRQVRLLDRYRSAAFAFGPRIVEADGSVGATRWASNFSMLHGDLLDPTESGLLDGTLVVRALTRGRLRRNAIGEPSVVLIRRSAIAGMAPFDVHLRQLTDFELWLRLAAASDVVFDSRPVARFRVHARSETMRNMRTGDAWLDRLRVVDALAKYPRTAKLIRRRHYAAAFAAGGRELALALLRRHRSLRTTTMEIKAFLQGRASTPRGQA